jgi:hypothetical protein
VIVSPTSAEAALAVLVTVMDGALPTVALTALLLLPRSPSSADDAGGVGKNHTVGQPHVERADDGDDASLAWREVCRLPVVVDTANGGDGRPTVSITDVDDVEGYHVGDEHVCCSDQTVVDIDQRLGDRFPW